MKKLLTVVIVFWFALISLSFFGKTEYDVMLFKSQPINVTLEKTVTTNSSAKLNLTVEEKPMTFYERLKKDVLSAPYDTSDYEKDKLDCSTMTALLYDWLKLKGYENVYVFLGHNGKYGHMWLLVGNRPVIIYYPDKVVVKTFGESYWIEATHKTVFRNLTDLYGDFYYQFTPFKILDDYRDFRKLGYQGLGYDVELNYSWYLIEKYGTSDLKRIAEMMEKNDLNMTYN